ncbi:MAG: acetyl-CoA carboxylase biotin carboxyl carrier protein [Rhizobiales bacterium]|nr:acetyl-CoA carboxylase biotin carboxyl carrier protein [Hyphomicrobiales bacterium]
MSYSKDISDVIRALSESGFEEAEIKLDDMYIRVSSAASIQDSGGERPITPNSGGASVPPARDIGNQIAPEASAVVASPDAGGTTRDIRSPTLGSFYRAPSPGAPPFVKIGDHVTIGQALGLVEVMKLFNTIEADTAGTVVAIHTEDGALVEHDQLLVTIRVD